MNKTITLPQGTVTDNIPDGCVLYVCCITPDGVYQKITDYTLRFSQKGVYTVKYMAMDRYRNMTVRSFEIQVN